MEPEGHTSVQVPKLQSLLVLLRPAVKLPLRTASCGLCLQVEAGSADPHLGATHCLNQNPPLWEMRVGPGVWTHGPPPHAPPVTSLDTAMVPSSLIRCSSSSKTSSSSGWMYLLRGGCGSRLCWNAGGGLSGARASPGPVRVSARAPQPGPDSLSPRQEAPWGSSGRCSGEAHVGRQASPPR